MVVPLMNTFEINCLLSVSHPDRTVQQSIRLRRQSARSAKHGHYTSKSDNIAQHGS